MRTVYLNGKFVPEAKAQLSIYDLSVMQAAAAFEMTRSFNGVQFKLREHLERLLASCRALALSFPWTLEEVETWCQETVARNDHGYGEEHRLLIVVSPGCAPMYKALAGVIPHPFLYIADFPLRYTVKGFSTYFTEGVHCVTSKIQQVPNACVPAAAKHRSRLHFHLAQMQAPAGTWPLMVSNGWVTEAPGANIVGVNRFNRGVVATWNALGGISQHTVAGLLRKDMEEVRTGRISLKRLKQCEEVFLTGTPFCMLPVVSIDGRPIGHGKPGLIYQETLAKWSAMVGVDIHRQIAQWDSQD